MSNIPQKRPIKKDFKLIFDELTVHIEANKHKLTTHRKRNKENRQPSIRFEKTKGVRAQKTPLQKRTSRLAHSAPPRSVRINKPQKAPLQERTPEPVQCESISRIQSNKKHSAKRKAKNRPIEAWHHLHPDFIFPSPSEHTPGDVRRFRIDTRRRYQGIVFSTDDKKLREKVRARNPLRIHTPSRFKTTRSGLTSPTTGQSYTLKSSGACLVAGIETTFQIYQIKQNTPHGFYRPRSRQFTPLEEIAEKACPQSPTDTYRQRHSKLSYRRSQEARLQKRKSTKSVVGISATDALHAAKADHPELKALQAREPRMENSHSEAHRHGGEDSPDNIHPATAAFNSDRIAAIEDPTDAVLNERPDEEFDYKTQLETFEGTRLIKQETASLRSPGGTTLSQTLFGTSEDPPTETFAAACEAIVKALFFNNEEDEETDELTPEF